MSSTKPDAVTLDLNLPDQWGADPLSSYLVAAWRHEADTFAEDPDHYEAIAGVDAAFRTLAANLSASPEPLAAVQVVRAHASLLAAAGLALSGQLAEAYVLMRSTLAAALQGLFVAGNSTRQQAWVGRNDDDEGHARMEEAFAPDKMRSHLERIDSATAAIFDKLDARAADRSAHANAHMGHVGAASTGDDDFDVEQHYFAVGDETQGYCLRSLAQTGICTLSMFYYVFPDLYRRVGLDGQITKLRQGH